MRSRPLTAAGQSPAVLPCLEPGSPGDAGLADPAAAKAAAGCAKTIGKAAIVFVGARTKAVQGCVRAVTKCLQTAADAGACLVKARQTCAKNGAKLAGVESKLRTALGKKCTGAALPFASVLAAEGLGFVAHQDVCVALGGVDLASIDDVEGCLARSLACRTDQLLGVDAPRLRELLELGALTLP